MAVMNRKLPLFAFVFMSKEMSKICGTYGRKLGNTNGKNTWIFHASFVKAVSVLRPIRHQGTVTFLLSLFLP